MLAVAIGLIAGAANAQTTVGAVVGVSDQSAGANDLPYLGLPFGGTKIAAIGLIDRDWRRRLAIGGEVSTAGQISGEQSQRNGTSTNAFVSRHRDTVFSATAKFGVTVGRVRASAVGGAGGALRRTSREGTTASIFPPASRAPFSDTLTNFVFAYSIGADVRFALTDRLAILAIGRRHRLKDDDRLASGVVARGVSSTIYRAGVGAQWRF